MPTPFDYPLGWGIWASRVPYERGRCKKMMSARENSVEIRIRGRWIRIPALDVNGKKLIASGKWLRTAKVRSDDMMEKELENPKCTSRSSRVKRTMR